MIENILCFIIQKSDLKIGCIWILMSQLKELN